MTATHTLVKNLLTRHYDLNWTLQGFGMLRTYLDEEHIYRLHVWDSRFQTQCVSTIHTHPWDFESTVVAGRLRNLRYSEIEGGENYQKQLIRCGEGGGLCDTPTACGLILTSAECLLAGDIYKQFSGEIHESIPEDGTVTLVKRLFKTDVDHAAVFWPTGTDWISAEPRKASSNTVEQIVEASLARWFKGRRANGTT